MFYDYNYKHFKNNKLIQEHNEIVDQEFLNNCLRNTSMCTQLGGKEDCITQGEVITLTSTYENLKTIRTFIPIKQGDKTNGT